MDDIWKRAWIDGGYCGVCWRDPCICVCEGCDWMITVPTCISAGEVTKKCTRSNVHNETIVVKPLGHNWNGSWLEVDGVVIKTCLNNNCDETQIRQVNDDMIWIDPDAFTMGSSDSLDWYASPRHQVTISKGFYMGKYEVTQEQYQAVTGVNPSSFTSNPASGETQSRRPVESVTWYDAVEFCNKLSEREGLIKAYTITNRFPETGYPITNAEVTVNWDTNGYRLPTEAEWEYACRAGTTTVYNTGETISDNTGWYYNNSNSRTHEAGKKPANAWGLYDMHGNVWEWCWDWYEKYESGAQTDLRGAPFGSNRIVRGGSWLHGAQYLRSAIRFSYSPNFRFNGIGFRLLRL